MPKNNVSEDKFWVYTGLDKRNKTILKRSITRLEDKHYVVAYLGLYAPYDLSNEEKINKTYESFNDFILGRGDLPVLTSITTKIKTIVGRDRFDLGDDIDKSVTSHWLYIQGLLK